MKKYFFYIMLVLTLFLPAEIVSAEPYAIVNDNIPYFTNEEFTTEAFEEYSELDELGRCGVAFANICPELMPTEERGEIGMIKPSGWHTVKYPELIDGNYLYNRCHLIGYNLAGENANEKNLITGTRYLNIEGMLPFENEVAGFVEETGYHVLYRVTPIFNDNELVARGVLIEAESVEDGGAGVTFNVYCPNVQPGIEIDYATGESWVTEDNVSTEAGTINSEDSNDAYQEDSVKCDYILNTNTRKFHYPYCSSVDQMKEKNKTEFTGSREELIAQGYSPCGNCNP